MDNKKFFLENVDRWTTMPAAAGRCDVEKLSSLEDKELLKEYIKFIPFWENERGWEYKKYSKLFENKDVIEVGSGFGYDGIVYSETANSYTYVDINEKQISFLKKIVPLVKRGLKSEKNNINYEILDDPIEKKFAKNFNAFYSHGVLHHVPLEFAKKEFANFDKFLEVESTVVLLMYPKERWIDCGKPKFEDFGIFTDGGCPWAEYYDEKKILELVGPNYRLDETIMWGINKREFVNFELTKIK